MEKFALYKVHHDAKTLRQFFSSLYEDYFVLWPPTPTPEGIEAANGNMAVAVATVRKDEQNVRDFEFPG